MYSDKSKKLITELKTSKWLPPYNSELIRQIQQEINNIIDRISQNVGRARESEAMACTIISLHSCVSRLKRSVLCYLNYRMAALEKLRWETGPNIPSHFEP